MGTLDQSQGTTVKCKIAIVNVTAYTPSQVETYFNDNYGNKGWRIIQFVTIGTDRYLLTEKEYA